MWKSRAILRLGSPLIIEHILDRWETLACHRNTWTRTEGSLLEREGRPSSAPLWGSEAGWVAEEAVPVTAQILKANWILVQGIPLSLPLAVNQERVGRSCYVPSALLFDMWSHCCHTLHYWISFLGYIWDFF